MSNAVTPERQQLLDAAFEADPENERLVVEHRGRKYEVRAPSLMQLKVAQKQSTKGAEIDDSRLTALLIVGSVYVPGTDDRVFEAAHIDRLLEMPVTKKSLFKALSEAIQTLAKSDPEEAAKNSESAPA